MLQQAQKETGSSSRRAQGLWVGAGKQHAKNVVGHVAAHAARNLTKPASQPLSSSIRRPPLTSMVVQAARRSKVSSLSNMALCSASVCSCVHRLQVTEPAWVPSESRKCIASLPAALRKLVEEMLAASCKRQPEHGGICSAASNFSLLHCSLKVCRHSVQALISAIAELQPGEACRQGRRGGSRVNGRRLAGPSCSGASALLAGARAGRACGSSE